MEPVIDREATPQGGKGQKNREQCRKEGQTGMVQHRKKVLAHGGSVA
jgi:hypothetical protein